jgi:hypothetical protein
MNAWRHEQVLKKFAPDRERFGARAHLMRQASIGKKAVAAQF